MTTTKIEGLGEVIITAGAFLDGVGRIYGVFRNEADARSEDADERAIGTVGASALTEEQRAIAEENSREIAGDLGLHLAEIAEKNVAKLASRQARGTLVGEGDAR